MFNLRSFDTKLRKLLKVMVEVGFGYIDSRKDTADVIYIYGCLEYFISFEFCYKINGTIVSKNEINDYSKYEFDTSFETQENTLDLGMSDLKDLKALFEGAKREVPKHIKIIYNLQTGSFTSKLIYDELIGNSEKMPLDIFNDWISEIKNDVDYKL